MRACMCTHAHTHTAKFWISVFLYAHVQKHKKRSGRIPILESEGKIGKGQRGPKHFSVQFDIPTMDM